MRYFNRPGVRWVYPAASLLRNAVARARRVEGGIPDELRSCCGGAGLGHARHRAATPRPKLREDRRMARACGVDQPRAGRDRLPRDGDMGPLAAWAVAMEPRWPRHRC